MKQKKHFLEHPGTEHKQEKSFLEQPELVGVGQIRNMELYLLDARRT